MYVQYCHCLKLDNFENVRKIVVPNGPYEETVLYCCASCYEKYFARTDVSRAMMTPATHRGGKAPTLGYSVSLP